MTPKCSLLILSEHIQIYLSFSNHNKPTCYCEFFNPAVHLFALDVDPAVIFASIGDSGIGQRVQKILRGAGVLGVDFVVALVYSVLTTQHLLPEAADNCLASHSHIGAPSHISTGLNGQGDVSYREY